MSDNLEITVGTHFFQVRPGNSEKAKALCFNFARRFIKVDEQGKERKVTVFAAANKERSWFRFHINSFSEFDKQLMLNGIGKDKVTVIYLPEPDVPTCTITTLPHWKVLDYQEPIIDYLTKPVGKYDDSIRQWVDGGARSRLVGIQTGKGKALPMDAIIQTPQGPRLNGDLVVGDVIWAWSGVQTVVTGVHPQGKMKVYTVQLCDGRKVRCSGDHLWGVYIEGDMERKVMSTTQIQVVMQTCNSVRIDLPRTGTAEENAEISALLASKGTGHRFNDGFHMLKFDTKEETLRVRDLAWKCGMNARMNELIGGKCLLFVVKNMDTFNTRTIPLVRITESNEEVEMQCIEIEHRDKLYVTGDWVVTHNTFCALKAISELGYKFVVIVLAQFVEKWAGGYDKVKKEEIIGDITKVLDIQPKEILKVQGGQAMQALTEMAITPGSMDPYKAVVISNRTFENYLRAYENYGLDMETMGYHVPPEQLWSKLGIGLRLVDEVHMHFHANFRIDLYTHIKRSVSLSATLRTRDETMNRMYKVAYPPFERFQEGPVDKYADSYGIVYGLPPNWHYKTTHRGNPNYNHTAYEASILKNAAFTKAYGDMFTHYLKTGYKANYKPGNKFIVFAASVEMCTKLTDHLSKKFPEYSIKRYVSGDPYQENYIDPDGRVTTIGSGGTGHDIKGLTDNHLGTAIDALQSNIQAFGRLRKIDDQSTRFYFYSCENIPKQMGYHGKKKDLMKERAKSYTPMFYGTLGYDDDRCT